mmetsp:Transcript_1301/g.4395  ORF Transcript_1301/g.4395 Transcript_1301/m.4395 type:complete len:332 (+) Transcript_1301:73-1068(+)
MQPLGLALVTVLGWLKWGYQDVLGKGSAGEIRDAIVVKWKAFQAGETAVYQERGMHHGMHEDMRGMVKECHWKCGADRDCHERCPKPWVHLAKKCEKMKPIMMCHKFCGHNMDCHAKCPTPQCPRMQAKVAAAFECHKTCKPGDIKCHQGCPKPLFHMAFKCAGLWKKTECHKACRCGDHACHHQCGAPFSHFRHHGRREEEEVDDDRDLEPGWHRHAKMLGMAWLKAGMPAEKQVEDRAFGHASGGDARMEKMPWMRDHGHRWGGSANMEKMQWMKDHAFGHAWEAGAKMEKIPERQESAMRALNAEPGNGRMLAEKTETAEAMPGIVQV